MSLLRVHNFAVSLDGFMAGPDGEIDWHLVDDELHAHINDSLRGMGAFLEGRVTYELMEEFWPTADQDPDSTPPMLEFAGIWREVPKVVYSRTLENWGGSANLTFGLSESNEIKSISSYRAINWTGKRDADNTPLTILHTIRKHDQEHPEQTVFTLAAEAVSEVVSRIAALMAAWPCPARYLWLNFWAPKSSHNCFYRVKFCLTL